MRGLSSNRRHRRRNNLPPPKQFPGNKPEVVRAGDDGALRLLATTARIYGPKIVFEEQYRNLGYWSSPDDYAAWSLEVPTAARISRHHVAQRWDIHFYVTAQLG